MFSKAVAMADHLGLDIVPVSRDRPHSERASRVLSLMHATIGDLPDEEVEVWEEEIKLRRRQLGLDDPTRKAQ